MSRLLLDTHTALWFLQQSDRISIPLRAKIESSQAYVSIASLWEIAIKVSLGKLELPLPFEELFPWSIEQSGLYLLPVTEAHAAGVIRLEHLHRDPFDRMLIAQALYENLTLVTRDPFVRSYPVGILWA